MQQQPTLSPEERARIAREHELRENERAEREQDGAIQEIVQNMNYIKRVIARVAQSLLSEAVFASTGVYSSLSQLTRFQFEEPNSFENAAIGFGTTVAVGKDDKLERELRQNHSLLWIDKNIVPLQLQVAALHAALIQLKIFVPGYGPLFAALQPHQLPESKQWPSNRDMHSNHSSGSNQILQAHQNAQIAIARSNLTGLVQYCSELQGNVDSTILTHCVGIGDKDLIACAIRLGAKVNHLHRGILASDYTNNWAIKLYLVEQGLSITLCKFKACVCLLRQKGHPI